MNFSGWKPIAAVLVVGSLLRLWGAFDYEKYYYDEPTIVPAAKSLLAYGTSNEWRLPPLHGILVAGALRVCGDNPVGWRIVGILSGTAAILLLYLVGRRLYPDSPAPLLAAALLAFDPFHVYFSRTQNMEMPVVVFFLAFLWAVLEYTERERWTLPLAGLAMGLTIATKSYFVFGFPLVIGYALWREWGRRPGARVATTIDFVACFALLPAAVYVFAHAIWLGRGYTLPDLVRMKYDAYWVFTNNFKFGHQFFLELGGKPWQWFLRPAAFGFVLASSEGVGRYAVEFHSPAFRWLVLPAVAFAALQAWRRRDLLSAAAPALFAACYALFFVVNRQFNSYSAIAVLPFAYLAVANGVVAAGRRWGREAPTAGVFLAAVAAVGLYLFPLAGGLPVPTWLYAPVFPFVDFTGGM